MARIAGVDLPNEKRVEVGLTYIFGIGPAISREILTSTGVSSDTRCKDLNEQEVSKLREYIERQRKSRRRSAPRGEHEHQAAY